MISMYIYPQKCITTHTVYFYKQLGVYNALSCLCKLYSNFIPNILLLPTSICFESTFQLIIKGMNSWVFSFYLHCWNMPTNEHDITCVV